ncbi:MAG: hypothetical protein ACRCVA_15405, partial [Phreatobacter sp.]
MRLATIEIKGERRVAVLSADGVSVRPLAASAGPAATSMLAAIAGWTELKGQLDGHLDAAVPTDSVTLLAPIPRPPRN